MIGVALFGAGVAFGTALTLTVMFALARLAERAKAEKAEEIETEPIPTNSVDEKDFIDVQFFGGEEVKENVDDFEDPRPEY